MKYLIAVGMLALATGAAHAQAKDVTGVWSITGDVEGVPVIETCTLVQKDSVVTGSCDTNTGKYDIAGGGIKDDGISFSHGGKYEGSDLTIVFTAKVTADAMTGTMDVTPFGVSGSFTAKKGAPAAK